MRHRLVVRSAFPAITTKIHKRRKQGHPHHKRTWNLTQAFQHFHPKKFIPAQDNSLAIHHVPSHQQGKPDPCEAIKEGNDRADSLANYIRKQPQPQNIKIPPLSLSYIITHKGLKIEGDLSNKIRDIAYDQALEFWAMPVTGNKTSGIKHTQQEAGQKTASKQALPTQGAVAHLRRHNKIGKAIIGPSREAFACTNYTSWSHTRLSYFPRLIKNRRRHFAEYPT